MAKKPQAEPEVSEEPAAEPEIVEQPAEAAAEPEVAEPAADEAADAPAEAEAEAPADGLDPELVEINAAVRPMRAADGSEASCDLYKSDKAGNVLVPAGEVPAMLEHGFVLVDDA